jgi:hypothetical protein
MGDGQFRGFTGNSRGYLECDIQWNVEQGWCSTRQTICTLLDDSHRGSRSKPVKTLKGGTEQNIIE